LASGLAYALPKSSILKSASKTSKNGVLFVYQLAASLI